MTCQICNQTPGEIGDHIGSVPLGPLRECDACGRDVCPVCFDRHECCEKDNDE